MIGGVFTRIVPLALVDLRFEERLCVPGFYADHWKTGLRQPAEQPLRQWTGFETDAFKLPSWILEQPHEVFRITMGLFTSRQTFPAS